MKRRYLMRTGSRRPFDETKHQRERTGRFGDKVGAGNDAPRRIKRAGLTREDVIEGLTERGARLNGRTIGEVLDESGDEAAALRNLAQRHKAGEIQFREGRSAPREDRVTFEANLGKRYEIDTDDIKLRGDRDDDAFEDLVEARVAKEPRDNIVLTAPLNVRRGSVSPESLRFELENSFDDARNRPGFLRGRVGEMERLAVEEAVDSYVKQHAKFFDREHDGGVVMVSIRRPPDSPYWKAKAAAEKRFRRDGLNDQQIEDEITGVADRRRAAAQREADAAVSAATRTSTDSRLREAYGGEVDRLGSLKGRDLFLARNALIQRFARERGERLAYD